MDVVGMLTDDVNKLLKKVDVVSTRVTDLQSKVSSQGRQLDMVSKLVESKDMQLRAGRQMSNFLTFVEIVVVIGIVCLVAAGFVLLIQYGGR